MNGKGNALYGEWASPPALLAVAVILDILSILPIMIQTMPLAPASAGRLQ